MKRVAIIGGGAAGLCAAKQLLSNARVLPVVYEQSTSVGGTWVYADVEEGVEPFSSVYQSLRTNLPKEVMEFQDMPHSRHLPSFLRHSDVKVYLEKYAQHFNLYKNIRFSTKVTHVSPYSTNGGDCSWKLTAIENDGERFEEVFDSVLVCNGHYTKPSHPIIPGIEGFPNKYLHSHYYRKINQLTGPFDVALVLGLGPSAIDISIELSSRFDTVFLSHRGKRLQTKLPHNIKEVDNIHHLDQSGHFVCDDGFVCKNVDLFLPCTGYEFHFPFLDQNVFGGLVTSQGRLVTNLYKHMFYVLEPTLCFIGIPLTVAPFPLIYQQCALAARVLVGKKELPSKQEMFNELKREHKLLARRGYSERYFHKFEMRQFDYLDDLARLSGEAPIPSYIPDIYKYVMSRRQTNVMDYRNDVYEVSRDSSKFRVS